MKTRKKWIVITLLIVVVVSVGLGYFLKQQHDAKHAEAIKQKTQLNNKNVKAFTDITYAKGVPNSQLDILTPQNLRNDTKLPIIFWMHGGGFIAGDKQYKNPLLSKIAEQGYIVVNVNYALAPDYKYPTPLKQMNQAITFMKKNEHDLPIDFDQVIFGGDSAGAQLVSQYTAIQTNDTLRKEMDFPQLFEPDAIKAAVFFGGFYDMKTVRETEFPRIELFMKSYTGRTDWETSFKYVTQMSTINQITKDYPPTFLSVGDADPFDSQNRDFYDALEDKDVTAKSFFFDGSHHLRHQYQFHLNKPESKQNIVEVLKFLSRHTSQSGTNRQSEQQFTSPLMEQFTGNGRQF